MGMSRYTCRAETKIIDGVQIGRFSYAYKLGFDRYPGARGNRTIAVQESRAEDAKYQNRNVRHFILADSFAEAADDFYPVFRIDREPPAGVTDKLSGALVVGFLRRVGRRYEFCREVPRLAA